MTHTRKGSDIRIRTRKKNESDEYWIKICGSDEGYTTRKKNDPAGEGYTYTNITYPGASYNIGNERCWQSSAADVWLQRIYRLQEYRVRCQQPFLHIVPVCFKIFRRSCIPVLFCYSWWSTQFESTIIGKAIYGCAGNSLIHQRRVPIRNDPCGSHCLRALFYLYYEFSKFHPVDGWVDVFTSEIF